MNFETTGGKAGQGRGMLFRAVRHPVVKALGIAAVALALANCSSHKSVFNKYGVKASPRVVAPGEPVPKGGGRYQVGKPYMVGGRTYVPEENLRYSETGLASWYGSDFHGRLTANGEIFDQYAVAAAHPTLPLPSYVRITNLANNRSMIVRVNDRGPYHSNRVMDVSETVADALDFKRAGTARVKIDYVGRASLNGSDDNVLLATLRSDGLPAQLQRVAPLVPAPAALAGVRPHPEMPQGTFSGSAPVARTIPAVAPLPPQRPYITGQNSERTQIAGLTDDAGAEN